MKKILCLLISLSLLLLTACASSAPAARGTTESSSPAVPEETARQSAADRAREYAMPMIETALAALEGAPRTDLSAVTYPFDTAYSYTGPSKDETELYGSEGDEARMETEDEAFLSAVCALVVENMPEEASAYDQYRYLAYFLSEATDYDGRLAGGVMSITPYGAIVEGNSICMGYTTAYLYLCEQADLWCQSVYGYSDSGVHGWNLVKLEDGTYYVDVTWSDGLGGIGTEDWMAYFMLTEDVLLQDHGIWSGGPATGTTIFD